MVLFRGDDPAGGFFDRANVHRLRIYPCVVYSGTVCSSVDPLRACCWCGVAAMDSKRKGRPWTLWAIVQPNEQFCSISDFILRYQFGWMYRQDGICGYGRPWLDRRLLLHSISNYFRFYIYCPKGSENDPIIKSIASYFGQKGICLFHGYYVTMMGACLDIFGVCR